MPELMLYRPYVMLTMLAFVIAEYIWTRRVAHRTYDIKASLASIGVAVGQLALKPLQSAVIASIYIAVAHMALLKIPFYDWREWLIGFFAVEFTYYWFHRWSHTINMMWATHAVHHSANEITLPAAIRLGWTGLFSLGWAIFLPLIVIGFPPKLVLALLGVNLLYQFALHTEVIRSLGPLEWVLNTPSHHRAHHASDEGWLDCNFGGVLIIFDRLFGTFVAEPKEGGLHYGLTQPIRSYNPVVIALQQWGKMGTAMWNARSWKRRFVIPFEYPNDFIAGSP